MGAVRDTPLKEPRDPKTTNRRQAAQKAMTKTRKSQKNLFSLGSQNPPSFGPWGSTPPSRHQASNPCRKRAPAILTHPEFHQGNCPLKCRVTPR